MTWTAERVAAEAAEVDGVDGPAATAIVRWLVNDQPPIDQGAAVLRAWAEVGETPAAIAAVVGFLRQHAVALPLPRPALDVCGTGGSGLTRFNVSTTVAFVLAALDIPVAKHGNRGSRRPNGSFDLLDALDVRFDLSPAAQQAIFAETNLVFCFARQHHPVVGKVAAYRQAAGTRTIFNLAGPLANPAPLAAQLVGSAEPGRVPDLAAALQTLGVERFVVCSGEPGIDECSVAGRTTWLAATENQPAVHAGACELRLVDDYARLPGGDAPVNAELFQQIIGAVDAPGINELRQMVVVNAALAACCWNGTEPAVDGPEAAAAAAAIADGRVAAAVARYRERARQLVSETAS